MSDLTLRRRQPAGRSTLIPVPEGTVRPTQYRWPSERAKLPWRCTHCATRLLRGDVPSADYPVVDVICLACGRVACELIADGWEPQRRITAAERAAYRAPERTGRPKKETACPESACLRLGPDGGLCGSCNVRQWRQKQKAAP